MTAPVFSPKKLNNYMILGFKHWLLSEVSAYAMGHIYDAARNRLKHIFGDKKRIVIPFQIDENSSQSHKEASELLRAEGYTLDWSKGLATKDEDDAYLDKIKQNLLKGGKPEQEVEDYINRLKSLKTRKKSQSVSIGKALAKHGQFWSDWWSHNNPNVYSIILSRVPVDIIKMSDDQNFSDAFGSCHSEISSYDYFRCALTEANRGGAIAYLVRKKDLEGVDLQSDQIFTNKETHFQGIKPIARLRLRRFEHHNIPGFELAIPELTVYGNDVGGFESSIMDFVKDQQEPVIRNMQRSEGKPSAVDFVLRGGTYEDHDSSELFNNYFNDTNDDGSASIHPEDKRYEKTYKTEEEKKEEAKTSFIEESEAIINNYKFKNPIGIRIEEGQQQEESPYIYLEIRGEIEFRLHLDVFQEDPDQVYSQYSFNKMTRTIEKVFRDWGWGGVTDVYCSKGRDNSKGYVLVQANFYDQEMPEVDSTQQVKEFCEWVKSEWDNDYERIEEAIREALHEGDFYGKKNQPEHLSSVLAMYPTQPFHYFRWTYQRDLNHCTIYAKFPHSDERIIHIPANKLLEMKTEINSLLQEQGINNNWGAPLQVRQAADDWTPSSTSRIEANFPPPYQLRGTTVLVYFEMVDDENIDMGTYVQETMRKVHALEKKIEQINQITKIKQTFVAPRNLDPSDLTAQRYVH